MRRIGCTVLFLILSLLFTGCAGKVDNKDTNSVSYCNTLNDYVRQGSQLIYYDEGILRYVDLTIGKSIVLCSKPNCKHQEYDYFTNANPECEAAAPQGSGYYQAVILDENTVYQFLDTNNVNETVIYKSEIDNPGRKKLCTIPYTVAQTAGVYYAESFIYMVGQYDTVDEVNHTVGSSGESLTILRINADTGECEMLSPQYYNDTICQILDFYLEGGNLYYWLRELKAGVSLDNIDEEYDWNEILDNKFYRLKTDGQSMPEMVIENFDNINSLLGIENGKLFYVDASRENICTRDLENNNDEVYVNTGVMERCEEYGNGQFVYVLNDDKAYYQNNKEKPVMICSDEHWPTLIYQEKVYVGLDEAGSPYILSLDDFLNGKGVDAGEE